MTYMSATGGNHWFYLSPPGVSVFSAPDTTAVSTRGAFVIADAFADLYRGFIFYPGFPSGATTAPLLQSVDTAGVSATRYFNGTWTGDLVTNGANYLSISGTTAGGVPTIAALGTDTTIDIQLSPKGTAGVVNFDSYTVLPGTGPGATLTTVSGTSGPGPTAAAQSYWLAIGIAGTTNRYFMPVWTT